MDVAKEALSKFDFLLELSHNSTCEGAALELMGFPRGARMGKDNAKVGSRPDRVEDRGPYERWNSLDVDLHRYARRLMEVDCEFFLRLRGNVDVVPMDGRAG